ncbi:unnamed protein product, partial [Mesorhabditis spiculigera]
MKQLLVLFYLFAVAVSQDFFKCSKTDLDSEQARFNRALNIDPNLSYTNVSALYDAIFAIFRQDMIKICANRQQFQFYLGAKYSDCINPYTISGYGISNYDAISYVQIWNRLEYACGGGFHIAVAQYGCIHEITQDAPFVKCFNDWKATTANFTDTQMYCAATSTYMQCGSTVAKQHSCYKNQPTIPYYLCESVRMGNARLCQGLPNQRCFV